MRPIRAPWSAAACCRFSGIGESSRTVLHFIWSKAADLGGALPSQAAALKGFAVANQIVVYSWPLLTSAGRTTPGIVKLYESGKAGGLRYLIILVSRLGSQEIPYSFHIS